MPISFTELNSIPDILASYRHTLFFPQLEGVDNQMLTFTKATISLPQMAVGHIQARILGHSIGFRGGLSFENIISVSILEVSNGANTRSLTNWHNMVRNRADGTSKLKAEYAKDGILEIYNTVGSPAMIFKLYNMFPVVIQYPEFSEQSIPAEYQVQFNTDYVELENGEQLSVGDFNSRFAGVA